MDNSNYLPSEGDNDSDYSDDFSDGAASQDRDPATGVDDDSNNKPNNEGKAHDGNNKPNNEEVAEEAAHNNNDEMTGEAAHDEDDDHDEDDNQANNEDGLEAR
jgi:hypothetical protein